MGCWEPGGTYAVYLAACPSDDARRLWLGPCLPEACLPAAQYLGEVKLPERGGLLDTPVADLAGVYTRVLKRNRYDDALAGYRRHPATMPSIELLVYRTGVLSLLDGNHRLTAARDAGVPTIRAYWTFQRV
jgi:hypothetical protein